MTGPKSTEADRDPNALKFYRHPTSGAYYGAYDHSRLRVKRGDQWGEFDRDGTWIGGQIRSADPMFCRWVTSEYLYNARLIEAKCDVWPLTRIAREHAEKATGVK